MIRTELLIVGAGAAGMACAVGAMEAGLRDVLIVDEQSVPGGVLPQCVHRGFGSLYYGEDMTGTEYARRFGEYFMGFRPRYLPETAVLRITEDKKALLLNEKGAFEAEFSHLVLAAGCRERTIESLGIGGARPSGVYTAGEAQKMINLRGWSPGERAVILGSGDTGYIMARRLTLTGKKVLLMAEISEKPGGLERNRAERMEKYGIPLLTDTTVSALHGRERLEAVTLRNVKSGELQTVACDTLITSIGMTPDRSLLREFGEIPHWVTLCGNCHHVHSIVDAVTKQGFEAGKSIAKLPDSQRKHPVACCKEELFVL